MSTPSNNERAFTLRKLPDGGVALALNLASTGFVVKVSPAEVKTITGQVIEMLKRAKGAATLSGAHVPVIKQNVHRAVVRLLGQRMARVAPSSLMGAAKASMSAKANLSISAQKLATAKKRAALIKARAAQRTAVQRRGVAQQSTHNQAARLSAANQVAAKTAKANQAGKMAAQHDAAVKAKSLLNKKIVTMTRAQRLVVARRAVLLAAQAGRKSVTSADKKAAQKFAVNAFGKMGLPVQKGNHAFYQGKTLKQVADAAAVAVNKLASSGAPATPPKPKQKPSASADKAKLALVCAAIALLTQRRSKMLAYEARKQDKPTTEEVKQGQAFAHQLFLKHHIPTTSAAHKFWSLPIRLVASKIDSVVKSALKLGAPVKVNRPSPVDRNTVAAYKKMVSTIAGRRAKFLARQRSGSNNVTKSDMKAGLAFSRSFVHKNGVPSPDGAHVFWQQSPPIVASKFAAVIKMAEVQGAPPPPPKDAPQSQTQVAKPVSTTVVDSKVDAVRQGLALIADRRAKFLAFHRQATFPSSVDIRDGKDFAKKLFTENQVPVRMPGKEDTIIGWAMAPRFSGMGHYVLPDQSLYDAGWKPVPGGLPPFPPSHPLMPNDMWPSLNGDPLPTREYQGMAWAHNPATQSWYFKPVQSLAPSVDPITAFWAQPLAAIQKRVAELVLQAQGQGAPLNPTGTEAPVNLYPPRDAEGHKMPAPGDVGPGQVPGQEPDGEMSPDEIPGEMPPGQMPGQEYPGDVPGEYPPDEIPGQMYEPPQPQPEIPGQMPPDFSAMDIAPGQMPQGQYPGQMYTDAVPGQIDTPKGQPPYEVGPGVVPGQEELYLDVPQDDSYESPQGEPQDEPYPGQVPEGFEPGEYEGIDEEQSDY